VTAAVLQSITVTPASPSVAAGLTQQFTATGNYSDSTHQDLTSTVTWSSSNTSYATIDATGLATGLTAGITHSVTIAATDGAISNTSMLRMTAAVLQSITVTPASPSVAAGLTQQFTATGNYSDSTHQDLTSTVTWGSDTPSAATIDTSGLATTVAIGTSTISATLGGFTDSTLLTVTAAVLQSITVTPASPSVAAGLTQQFTATGNYSDNTHQDLTSTVTWSSSNTSYATIDATGLATGLTAGITHSVTITATDGAISNTATLSITAAVLQSIAVTPSSPSVGAGLTQQFTATGTYSDSTTQNLTSTVTWSSSNTSYATIVTTGASGGLATGLVGGLGQTVTITATSGAISSTATLSITNLTTTTTVSASANPGAVGQPVIFTATMTATGGQTPTGTVQFQVDGKNVGNPVTVVSGSASFQTSTLSFGTHPITALFTGTNGFLNSTGSLTETIVKTNPAPAPGTIIVKPLNGLPPIMLPPGVPLPAGTIPVSSVTGLGPFVRAAENLAVALMRAFRGAYPRANITVSDVTQSGYFMLDVSVTAGPNSIAYVIVETQQSVQVQFAEQNGTASEIIVAQQNGQGASFVATGTLLSLSTLVTAVPQLPIENTTSAAALLARARNFYASHPGALIVFSKSVGATDSFDLTEVSGKSQFGFNL
jgi:uncharacterized protein YjdB